MNDQIKIIQKSIDELVVSELGNLKLNEEIQFSQEKLYEALNSRNKFDEKETFEDYVWQDCDPIGKNQTEQISEYESFVEKVRDIQNDIIDQFVPFKLAYSE